MKRPHISVSLKLEVALRQLGLDPSHVRLDHHPPLEQRMKRTVGDGKVIYSPDANNPRYLQWLSTEAHEEKTTGRRGTSKLSKRGGDVSEIAKTKRLEAKRFSSATKMFDTLMAEADRRKPRKRAWPKRKFPARKRTKP